MHVLLVQPPFVQLNAPYPATAYLASFLRREGHDGPGRRPLHRAVPPDLLRAGFARVFTEAERRLAGRAAASTVRPATTCSAISRTPTGTSSPSTGIVALLAIGRRCPRPRDDHRRDRVPWGHRSEGFLEANEGPIAAADAPIARQPRSSRTSRISSGSASTPSSRWCGTRRAKAVVAAGLPGRRGGRARELAVRDVLPAARRAKRCAAARRGARPRVRHRPVPRHPAGRPRLRRRGEARLRDATCPWRSAAATCPRSCARCAIPGSSPTRTSSATTRGSAPSPPSSSTCAPARMSSTRPSSARGLARGARVRRRRPRALPGRAGVRDRRAAAGRATWRAIDERAIREVFPDYAGLDFARYVADRRGHEPHARALVGHEVAEGAARHGCYWRRCAFCDTTLEYIARFAPSSARAPARAPRRAGARDGPARGPLRRRGPARAAPRALRAREPAPGPAPVVLGQRAPRPTPDARTRAPCSPRAGSWGCRPAWRSPREQGLENTRKGITLEGAVASLAALKANGILAHAYLIYGWPGQSERDLVDSMEIVRQLFAAGLVDSAFWHRFILTRHSPMYAEWKAGLRPDLAVVEPSWTFGSNDLVLRGGGSVRPVRPKAWTRRSAPGCRATASSGP